MIYAPYSRSAKGFELSLRTARKLLVASLAAYPAGAVLLVLRGDTAALALTLVGLGLILLSLVAAAALMGSRLQRIVAEQPAKLTEAELRLRQRATTSAYAAFTALVCAAVLYAALASDFGWWLPSDYEHYNGLFWGVFLYASLLPTAFLAWRIDDTGAALD